MNWIIDTHLLPSVDTFADGDSANESFAINFASQPNGTTLVLIHRAQAFNFEQLGYFPCLRRKWLNRLSSLGSIQIATGVYRYVPQTEAEALGEIEYYGWYFLRPNLKFPRE